MTSHLFCCRRIFFPTSPSITPSGSHHSELSNQTRMQPMPAFSSHVCCVASAPPLNIEGRGATGGRKEKIEDASPTRTSCDLVRLRLRTAGLPFVKEGASRSWRFAKHSRCGARARYSLFSYSQINCIHAFPPARIRASRTYASERDRQ